MKKRLLNPVALLLTVAALLLSAEAQTTSEEIPIGAPASLNVFNLSGKVTLRTIEADEGEQTRVSLIARSLTGISKDDFDVSISGKVTDVRVREHNGNRRVDLELRVPPDIDVRIETKDGAVTVEGSFRKLTVRTYSGTIAANVPTSNLSYLFEWTGSRPRYASDIDLPAPRERSGGRFEIKGSHSDTGEAAKGSEKLRSYLRLTTSRGIILLNVPPNEIANDLRERPLTKAAKAIIRSGDSLLMEAVRRAAPQYFRDYARTLPPLISEPRVGRKKLSVMIPPSELRRVSFRVVDGSNRALNDISIHELEVSENGAIRETLEIKRSEAPFNLVLLLDVSGSVDRYITFIRKAARAFLETASEKDRIAIVTFADDVNVLSEFSTDRVKLSASLDSFEAGGGTAFYDALAYTLAETLRPLAGERSAIVVLTDGDDNRSFLAFDTLLGPIEESGAIVYPLYVPSGVMAAADLTESGLDPLRERYLNSILTDKAKKEGPRLAAISGGVFYNITQLSDIQKAYDDIVSQLRNSYEVTYRSSSSVETPLNRIRIRSLRPDTFVQVLNIEPVR
jgi:VWFA-related protein